MNYWYNFFEILNFFFSQTIYILCVQNNFGIKRQSTTDSIKKATTQTVAVKKPKTQLKFGSESVSKALLPIVEHQPKVEIENVDLLKLFETVRQFQDNRFIYLTYSVARSSEYFTPYSLKYLT